MPLLETKGAASAQGFGLTLGGAAPNYIENVFSTYLYTGLGSTQLITNGIDLAGKGGLVWIKSRTSADSNQLFDTNRGVPFRLATDLATGQTNPSNTFNSFDSNGFTIGPANVNLSGVNYTSWTFRKQPKFFDVVTYTGNGANRTIAHNLGSVPGCIIVKRTDTTADWQVYHRSLANTEYMVLNTTAAKATGATRWNSTTPTSTVFSLGTDTTVNANGGTYVAYLFAHDASGFGLTGTDNVISCGSYTGNGSATGPTVTLGYEPQWLMIKNASGTGNWQIIDGMRGMPVGSADATLQANLSNAESSVDYVSPTSTGFQIVSTSSEVNTNASTYIYIAIRRGPMKTPTTGTQVFSPITNTTTTGTKYTTGFPIDTQIGTGRSGGSHYVLDRIRGVSTVLSSVLTPELVTNGGAIESSTSSHTYGWDNTGFYGATFYNGVSSIYWNFRRAPSFFDIVCYTGNGTAGRTVEHNLKVIPELILVKRRGTGASSWYVYSSSEGNTKYLILNSVDGSAIASFPWNNTSPTSTVFSVGSVNEINGSSQTYIAYLFATCPGVSKVGSYTGSGTTKQIDCGFTGGARFVLIKRTDSTGDWYVWDSARGIVAGNDPYLLLNSAAAEVTNTDYIDTYSAGFEISSTAPAAINANGGTYIYLAIA